MKYLFYVFIVKMPSPVDEYEIKPVVQFHFNEGELKLFNKYVT